MHITSLPSQYGIGDFGPAAYEFADFLKEAGQSFWQILPLNYTTAKTRYSPYNCFSAFAGNPLLISPQLLYREGLLEKGQIKPVPAFPHSAVDYARVSSYKTELLNLAFERFAALRRSGHGSRAMGHDFEEFCQANKFWLEDFATFVALSRRLGKSAKGGWCEWPSEIRDRSKQAIKSVRRQLQADYQRECFLQYVFYKQYFHLKSYCGQRGIKIIGDVPIYVAYDSADVWAHPEVFKLTRAKKPRYVAGVPPDYFSRTGQLWGNPVYNWKYLEDTDFAWWMDRIRHNLRLYDLVRIDHFRGLCAYWQVPAGQKTAIGGEWVEAPKDKFFAALFKQIPSAPIFAEDLGHITADVREVIDKYNIPCTRVLQFGFDGDPKSNPHYPANTSENCLVYTGTHDNNTTRGWFQHDATSQQKRRLFDYCARKVSTKDVHWEMIRLAVASPAKIAIIPMQDVLGLGAEARMNHPAKAKGNWLWRLPRSAWFRRAGVARRMRKMVESYGRGIRVSVNQGAGYRRIRVSGKPRLAEPDSSRRRAEP
jgi:4-alpha-glucanotransferase